MSVSHQGLDTGLLDELARCYVAAVVRSLLEGPEENPGERHLGATLVSPKEPAPDSTPDDEVPY